MTRFGNAQQGRAKELFGWECIAKSETVPAGSTIEFEVECLDPKLEDMVRECLNYGRMRGIGQWRNSGKGTYLWDELDANGNVIGGNNKKGD